MAGLVFINAKSRERYLKIVRPIGNAFSRMGIHPHVLTVAGLILSLAAGFVYSTGSFFWGAWVVVLAGSCDALDGQIARQSGKVTSFGAFLDSTLDRVSDVFLLAGMAYFFSGGAPWWKDAAASAQREPSPWTVILILFAITGSFMVSYTRARAEAIGVECKIGLMQRPERVTLLIIGSLLGGIPWIGHALLKCALLVLVLSSHATAILRIRHVGKTLKKRRIQS